MKKRKFKEITASNFFIFENPGDVVEGVVTGYRTIETVYGDADAAILRDDEGRENIVLISSGMRVVMDKKGFYLRITFKGMERNAKTKRTFKAFKVEVVEEEVPFDK